jgi:geranylgeranyl reductase family protein
MERVDVAVVGGGPAGSTCAAFCAEAGLRTVVLDRGTFPREKVCGDCLNPICWPLLRRLKIADQVCSLPHAKLDRVDFTGIGGARVSVNFPRNNDPGLIAIKRSLFDHILLKRARAAGAEIHEGATVTRVKKACWGDWQVDVEHNKVTARILVAADGRNSTVARLRNLLPRAQRERVALQAHIPLPPGFGNRVVLQFLSKGYSGQAPINGRELNLCVAGKGPDIASLKEWAATAFGVALDHPWRTATPLRRDALRPVQDNLFLIGDAARVVEPFTGEGIYYALRSGEIAAHAIKQLLRGKDREIVLRRFAQEHGQMYRGRLWVNELTRAAVLLPRIASVLLHAAQIQPVVVRALTRKVVSSCL